MTKVAFLASFLAAFITMDEQFFDGSTTRQIWRDVCDGTQWAQNQVVRIARTHKI